MANTKISALTAASTLDGTELLAGVQSGGNVKITATQIKTFTSASPTLVTPEIGAATGASLTLTGTLQAGSSGALQLSTDTVLRRDAANTLALRNSTNAQTFNVYNTYTDASNYERLEVAFESNIARVRAVAAGTGMQRNLQLSAGGGNIMVGNFQITMNNATDFNGNSISNVVNSTGQSGYSEMIEMTAPSAPSANRVRVYAEDNGAGKTRLMARFNTGAAQQIAIEP